MKRLFINMFKNKYFIILLTLFLLVLVFLLQPVLSYKLEYMELHNIDNFIYLYYVFLLPITFYDMSVTTCMILDLCYFSIILYVIVNFIDYLFKRCSSTILTRINRDTLINKIIKLSCIYSFIMTLVYIVFFFILCWVNNINFIINISILIPILYKLIISIILPNIYLFTYIFTDNNLLSTFTTALVYILLELLIRTTFDNSLLVFNNYLLVFIFLIVMCLVIIYLIKIYWQRRDV